MLPHSIASTLVNKRKPADWRADLIRLATVCRPRTIGELRDVIELLNAIAAVPDTRPTLHIGDVLRSQEVAR